ncbi:MAG TPA: transposase [Edaphobacter sp.]|nr:transposase [Edaphobacter sp.]
MPRAPQELHTYFITTVTSNRRRLFQVEQNATLFVNILQEQRSKNRIQLHAFVIMPDHVHLLLTPAPDVSLEKAMQYIKGNFSFRLKSKLDVWERSYDSRRIIDADDYSAHQTYIHQNPIRANLASEPSLYPHSTANQIHRSDSAPAHLS